MRFIDKLSKPKILSEIFRDMGQVFFASVLIEPALSHSTNSSILFFGLVSSGVCWIAGLILAKK
jgi:hypothetical protein